MTANAYKKLGLMLIFISLSILCQAVPMAIGLNEGSIIYRALDYMGPFFFGVATTIFAVYGK